MSYTYYSGYQQPQFYQPPMPDQLAQLRGAQYQPQQFAQQPPQQAGGQSMVWVSGEQEAMGYLVAPNSAVALWDSNAPPSTSSRRTHLESRLSRYSTLWSAPASRGQNNHSRA